MGRWGAGASLSTWASQAPEALSRRMGPPAQIGRGQGRAGQKRTARALSLAGPLRFPNMVWKLLSLPQGLPEPLLALKFEFKAVLTCARRKGEKSPGHLSVSLCFLLGSGRVYEGEDSCLFWEAPERGGLCLWPGTCSWRHGPQGTRGCAGVWRSACLVPGLSAQTGPGALGHQDLALNVRILAMERPEMLMPLLHQAQELGAWGYTGTSVFWLSTPCKAWQEGCMAPSSPSSSRQE